MLAQGDPDSQIYPAIPALLRVATNIQTLKFDETLDIIPDMFNHMQGMDVPSSLETLFFHHGVHRPIDTLSVVKEERHEVLQPVGNIKHLKVDLCYETTRHASLFGTHLSTLNDLASLLRMTFPILQLLPVSTWTINTFSHRQNALEDNCGWRKLQMEFHDDGGMCWRVVTDVISRSKTPEVELTVSLSLNLGLLRLAHYPFCQEFARDLLTIISPHWQSLSRVIFYIAVDPNTLSEVENRNARGDEVSSWQRLAERLLHNSIRMSEHSSSSLMMDVKITSFDRTRQKRPLWDQDDVLFEGTYRCSDPSLCHA